MDRLPQVPHRASAGIGGHRHVRGTPFHVKEWSVHG